MSYLGVRRVHSLEPFACGHPRTDARQSPLVICQACSDRERQMFALLFPPPLVLEIRVVREQYTKRYTIPPHLRPKRRRR